MMADSPFAGEFSQILVAWINNLKIEKYSFIGSVLRKVLLLAQSTGYVRPLTQKKN